MTLLVDASSFVSIERRASATETATIGPAEDRVASDGDKSEAIAPVCLTSDQQSMVEANLPLVHHIVNKMGVGLPRTYTREDFIQAGSLGLIEATRRFDPNLGNSFATYAAVRIKGAVLDHMRTADWASRSVRQNQRHLQVVEANLRTKLNRDPTNREVSSALGVTTDQLLSLRSDLSQARVDSLDRIADSPNGQFEPFAPAAPHPRDGIEERELRGYLRDAVTLLPERHRLIILGHFVEGRSITELGAFLGVTQSRASQLKQEALIMLRQGLDANLEDEPSRGNRDLSRRQREFNDALGSASDWQSRLEDEPL